MSSVLVHMPDDGWFKPGCNTEPDDKMLCVIIYAYGGRTPADGYGGVQTGTIKCISRKLV